MIVSIKLPQLLHIDPRKQIMHKNATSSLSICFAVSFFNVLIYFKDI